MMNLPVEVPFSTIEKKGLSLPTYFSSWLSIPGPEGTTVDPFYLEHEDLVVWRFSGGEETTGPPGYCHGGFLASVLDECMGSCGIWKGKYLMAVNLNVSYKKAVETGSTMFCVCRIKTISNRKVEAEGWITDDGGRIHTTANGTYLSVNPDILKTHPPGITAFNKYRQLFEKGYPIREILATLASE